MKMFYLLSMHNNIYNHTSKYVPNMCVVFMFSKLLFKHSSQIADSGVLTVKLEKNSLIL